MHDGDLRDPKLVLALLVVAALLLAGGTAFWLTAPEPEAVSSTAEAAAIEVSTLAVEPSRRRDRAVVSGVFEARRRVRLSAETTGSVLEVGAEALDAVEAGQVLVEIDPLRARAAVERAQAAVTRATSELSLAQSSFDRQQSLKERDVTSESAYDDAITRQRVAEAAIREARATLAEARDELEKKTIRAPFAGVLASFSVEKGEYVREGQELGELLDLSTARTTIGLSDRQIVGMESGAPVVLRVEAYPNREFQGEVLRVGVAIDAETRKFPVEIEIPNDSEQLLPGMVARVELALRGRDEGILVPREALIEEYDLRFVYVVGSDAEGDLRARRRRVAVRDLPFEPGLVEVTSGLSTGDRVAISGVQSLQDGAHVRVREVIAPANLPEASEAPTS